MINCGEPAWQLDETRCIEKWVELETLKPQKKFGNRSILGSIIGNQIHRFIIKLKKYYITNINY